MQLDVWQRIDEVFAGALQQEAAFREAWVDAACAGDAELRSEVASLLRAHEEARSFLGSTAHLPEADPGEAWAGRRLGPYRLLHVIGRGGMSTVLLAERSDEAFERRVAVKIVRAGFDAGHLLSRFLVERQVLARLEHPNIARLYDGGTTDEGLPYLVLEHVEGLPIDEYCDRHRLSVRQRLRLMLDVCAAVEYAHRHLIVHRDLKPANLLVTADGTPKLLDFGIAKLLAPERVPHAATTQLGQQPFTPRYASPEQLCGGPITVATDIYALGVLLYRLLTGCFPGLRTSSAPVRPSERWRLEPALGGDALPLEEAGRLRRETPRRLRRQLTGDLDAILLKALEEDPDRRYRSVGQLAEDLERHLEDRPVTVCRGTWSGRTAKLLRRNRLAAGLAALVFALTAGFAAFGALQARQLRHERDRVQKALAVLEGVFSAADPDAPEAAEPPSTREILRRGAEQVLKDLDEEPDVQGTLLAVLGRVHSRLGLYAEAEPLLMRALEVRRRQHGEHHPEVAESLHDLGALHHFRGGQKEAEAFYREALMLRREERSGDGEKRLVCTLNCLGSLLRERGALAAAEPLHLEALEIQRRLLPPEDPELAVTLSNLGILRRAQGDLEEAGRFLREALTLRRRALGDRHPRTAQALSNLGAVLNAQGRFGEAEPLLREALDIRRHTLDRAHPEVASSLHNLATTLQTQGDLAAAEPLYREVLAIRKERQGEDHPSNALAFHNLGRLLLDLGRNDEAEALLRKALEIRRRSYGEEHVYVAQSLHQMARMYLASGDRDEAEALFRRTLEMLQKLLSQEHPFVSHPLLELAGLEMEKGDLMAAETGFRKALAIRRRALPSGHWETAVAAGRLGECLLRQGRLAEAGPLLADSHATLAATFRPADPRVREARLRLAGLQTARAWLFRPRP